MFPWIPLDIDECTSVDDVCMNGRCENTPGDYACRCNTGYTLSTDKHMCLGRCFLVRLADALGEK